MKIDLGDYKYCETDELEELGKIKDKTAVWFGHEVKINGSLFKTPSGTYIFFGRVYNPVASVDIHNGWTIVNAAYMRNYLSLCDTVNDTNKWDLLGYTKV